jgi:two-component system, OmpR family, osmolarity sensor histidine kinase EnvZ
MHMIGRILKSILPRGLLGRAGLILLVPVLTILVVVWYVFIERHYDGVTRQMVGEFARSMAYLRAGVAEQPDHAAAMAQLARFDAAMELDLALVAALPPGTPPLPGPAPMFFELSSRILLEQTATQVAGLVALDMEGRFVRLWLDSPHGLIQVEIPAWRLSATNPHQLLLWMVLAGVIMSMVAFAVMRRQLRPIRTLSQVADAFGRGQNLPFQPSGALEVRAAGEAFLQMRQRIDHHIEQRTLMLSGVSHDLRTPLTRMRLGLSMLEPDPEARAMLGDVAEMESLIDRFLEFARSGASEPLEHIAPRALLAERVADAQRRGGDVTLRPGANPVPQAIRRAGLSRALDNAINNALRYANRAEVSLEHGPEGTVFIIEDDGPGIPPDLRGEAVKPFVRLDSARNSDRGSGVGLGLAIATDALRRHGGQLLLGQSRALGGLEVRMVVPTQPPHDGTSGAGANSP